jgi:hypothetical protein
MLVHRTVYENLSLVQTQLPFINELQEHHPEGTFHLLRDPIKTKETLIIGMFVLRPAKEEAYSASILDEEGKPTSMFNPKLDWCFNLDGLDGGGPIADGSSVDAYRLGMQYGLADCVIVGSSTVAVEGVDKEGMTGYVWQPYNPLSWPHVHNNDPNILEKVYKQRKAWQDLGYLSSRRYPAQVVYTATGLQYPGVPDFLTARVFHATHPTGEEIEVYIVTSKIGAERIRNRASLYGLSADRIEKILIVLSEDDQGNMQLSALPHILYNQYDIRIANHDGGQKVLREFNKAHILHQMNLTLGRGRTLLEAIKRRSDILEEKKRELLLSYDDRIAYFFQRDEKAVEGVHGFPKELEVAAVLADHDESVAVVTFAPPLHHHIWWK